MLHPETATLCLGDTEAPFTAADLPADTDLELRIFIDKYLVEIFINDRQAVVAAYTDYQAANGLHGYTFGIATTIKKIEIWRLKSTNQGFLEARQNRIWETNPQ